MNYVEPTFLRKGDPRLILNGMPCKVDCRVVSEEVYQELIKRSEWGYHNTILLLINLINMFLICGIYLQ